MTLREDHVVDPISEILKNDPELLRLRRLLLEQQPRLKKAVTREASRLYLDIEVTEGKITDVLAERCWEAAQRAGGKTKPRKA